MTHDKLFLEMERSKQSLLGRDFGDPMDYVAAEKRKSALKAGLLGAGLGGAAVYGVNAAGGIKPTLAIAKKIISAIPRAIAKRYGISTTPNS